MYKVSLKSGFLELSSESAMNKIERLSSEGLLWSYISDLINSDIDSGGSSTRVDELFTVTGELLEMLRSGKLAQIASPVNTVPPVAKSEPIQEIQANTVSVKAGGEASNVLSKLKGFSKG